MEQITPVGILSEKVAESIDFYRSVLEIENITIKPVDDDCGYIRLDSSKVEIFSTVVRIFDRPGRNYSREHKRLTLYCSNASAIVERFRNRKVSFWHESGKWFFTDVNGIEWSLSESMNQRLAA